MAKHSSITTGKIDILNLKKNLLSSVLSQSVEYQTRPRFARNIHKLGVLAFLNLGSAVTDFELLCEELGEQYDNVLDYFEETYIGTSLIDYVKQLSYDLLLGKLQLNRVRRKVLFEIKFRSVHSRTTPSSMRTKNLTEAYHRRISLIFQYAHPTLWLFLRKLIDEENVVNAGLVQINAGKQAEKKKTNEHLEKRLINLLDSIHDQLSVQLDSIAQCWFVNFF